MDSMIGMGQFLKSNRIKSKGVVGLKNLGNTCFLNAVLQSLASVRSFHAYVNSQPKKTDSVLTSALEKTLQKLSKKNEPFAPPVAKVKKLKEKFLTSEQQDAHEFMQYVISMLSDETEVITVPSLSSALYLSKDVRPSHTYFQVSRMQSIHAKSLASSLFINHIQQKEKDKDKEKEKDEEIPKNRTLSDSSASSAASTSPSTLISPSVSSNNLIILNNSTSSLLETSPTKSTITTASTSTSNISTTTSTSTAKSTISSTKLKSITESSVSMKRNPFSGILKSTLECTGCKQRSQPSYQKFNDLSLSIPEEFFVNKKLPTLEDCLELFTTTETVRDVDCSNCLKPKSAKKQLTIARAPKTLCLHIRRLIGMGGPLVKLNCPVEFPMELDLSPFCSFSEPKDSVKSTPNKTSNNKTYKVEKFLNLNFESTSSSSSIVGGTQSGYEQVNRRSEWKSQVEIDENSIKTRRQRTKKEQSLIPTSITSSSSSLNYELVAVIVHHGNHSGGHYTVYRKLLNDPSINLSNFISSSSSSSPSWYYISDETVRKVTEDEVLRAQAYMLYYEKCELE